MVLLLTLWGFGCAETPPESLTWREQWELFVVTEDGSLIEGRVVTGNTGLYRGQGRFRASRWMPGTTPIVFAMDGGPADIDIGNGHESVRVGAALLGRYEDGPHWTLRLAHEEANAIVHVDPGGPLIDLATGMNDERQWTTAVPIANGQAHGWFTAGRRGGKFEGRALALHRGGDGALGAPRAMVSAFGPEISIGFDQQGPTRSVWARIRDRVISTESVVHRVNKDGTVSLDFRPSADLMMTVVSTEVGGQFNGHDGLMLGERWVAEAVGKPAKRTVNRGRATIEFEGETLSTSGVILSVQ